MKTNFIFLLEAQQRLLLVTVFALSVHYQPVDVSLAISTGLLNVLSQLCGTDTLLGQPLQLLPKTGISQLSTALKVASTRLLQILAITTGWVWIAPLLSENFIIELFSTFKNNFSFVGAFLRPINVVQKHVKRRRQVGTLFIRKIHIRLINVFKLQVRSLDQNS